MKTLTCRQCYMPYHYKFDCYYRNEPVIEFDNITSIKEKAKALGYTHLYIDKCIGDSVKVKL